MEQNVQPTKMKSHLSNELEGFLGGATASADSESAAEFAKRNSGAVVVRPFFCFGLRASQELLYKGRSAIQPQARLVRRSGTLSA